MITVVICLTFLFLITLERKRVCGFTVKAEGIEVSAVMNYELKQ